MKHSKKYIILLLGGSIFLGACKKNFEEINTPPKDATDASTPQIFNAIVSSLPLGAGEQSVFNSWIYPITQQAIITSGAYPYDNAKAEVWTNYYTTLANYHLIESRIAEAGSPSSMNNLYAMLKTIMAYKTFKVTNYYGDMPYTSGGYAPLKGADYYKAPYDKQADIYTAILNDLTWAVDNFSSDASQFSVGSSETLFKNDVALWKKFANSLRLYIAATVYDKNQSLAAQTITDALSKPLLEDGDNVGIWPSETPGLQFQWRQWSFSDNCYLRMGSTMWDLMSADNNTTGSGIFDPRCKIFFEPNNNGEWAAYPQNPTTATPTEGGAPYNKNRFTSWADKGGSCIYSPVNLYFEQDITYIPELILTAAQIHLIKAEIYNRGMGVAASATSAASEYYKGIEASVNMWKGIAFNSSTWAEGKPTSATASPAELTALETNPKIVYNAANVSAGLAQIYAQLWIDQFRQPWDAWLLLRRTGGLTPMSASNTQYYSNNFGTYHRFVYPDDEANYNRANWSAATGGTDANTTKLWIEK